MRYSCNRSMQLSHFRGPVTLCPSSQTHHREFLHNCELGTYATVDRTGDSLYYCVAQRCRSQSLAGEILAPTYYFRVAGCTVSEVVLRDLRASHGRAQLPMQQKHACAACSEATPRMQLTESRSQGQGWAGHHQPHYWVCGRWTTTHSPCFARRNSS